MRYFLCLGTAIGGIIVREDWDINTKFNLNYFVLFPRTFPRDTCRQ